MTAKVNYPYVTDNNLENIQSYQYSLWQGDNFIAAFYAQRLTLLQSLPAAQWLECRNEFNVTSNSLWPLVLKLRNGQPLADHELDWVLILLKKFEVSKKLFGVYHSAPPHKRCDENFREPEPYMLLAELTLRLWLQLKRTYWLSGALKLLDTLCSIASGCREAQQAGIASLLELEQQLITSLQEVVSEPA
ncbi:hypothetical protein [Aeromonas enteropelogenes]|uniref:hypothetical protein n=1 Tax=Aeromonas enteropelogenes TaxID=29489 RepID=UPI003BA3137B